MAGRSQITMLCNAAGECACCRDEAMGNSVAPVTGMTLEDLVRACCSLATGVMLAALRQGEMLTQSVC